MLQATFTRNGTTSLTSKLAPAAPAMPTYIAPTAATEPTKIAADVNTFARIATKPLAPTIPTAPATTKAVVAPTPLPEPILMPRPAPTPEPDRRLITEPVTVQQVPPETPLMIRTTTKAEPAPPPWRIGATWTNGKPSCPAGYNLVQGGSRTAGVFYECLRKAAPAPAPTPEPEPTPAPPAPPAPTPSSQVPAVLPPPPTAIKPTIMKREAAPTEAPEEVPAEEPLVEEPEPKWVPYVLYGGIAAGVLTVAGIVALVFKR